MENLNDLQGGDINYRQIAVATGYDSAHIYRVLKGQAKPSVDCLRALAVAMEVDMGELDAVLAVMREEFNKEERARLMESTKK